MSEIQIILPLSAIAGISTDLNAQTIMQNLNDSMQYKQDLNSLIEAYNNLVYTLNGAGRNIDLILDEVDDQYEKARALRKLAAEFKNFRQMQRHPVA